MELFINMEIIKLVQLASIVGFVFSFFVIGSMLKSALPVMIKERLNSGFSIGNRVFTSGDEF